MSVNETIVQHPILGLLKSKFVSDSADSAEYGPSDFAKKCSSLCRFHETPVAAMRACIEYQDR
jgi:hypothetical protein